MSTSSRSNWSPLFMLLLVMLILAAADLLIIAVQVLLLILAGVLFGLFLNGVSRLVSRRTPLSYRAAYAVLVILLFAVAAGACYYAGSQLAQEMAGFTEKMQSAVERVDQRIKDSAWGSYYSDAISQSKQMTDKALGAVPTIMTAAGWLIWGGAAVVVILVVGLYVAHDPALYETGIVKLVPLDRRDRALAVIQKLRSALGWWIIGRLISMSIVGLATAIGLWLLGVPLPVPLAVLAALLTFIPNVGPILAAVPQALLAFEVGLDTVLYVLLFNLAIQTAESYLITPVVMRYEASLPPVLTISSQLLMAVLFGPIGVIMAAPLTLATMVLVQTLYIKDRLGDPEPGQLAQSR